MPQVCYGWFHVEASREIADVGRAAQDLGCMGSSQDDPAAGCPSIPHLPARGGWPVS